MTMNMMKYHQMRKLQTKIQHQRFGEFCRLFVTCSFYDVIKFVLYFALFLIKSSDFLNNNIVNNGEFIYL